MQISEYRAVCECCVMKIKCFPVVLFLSLIGFCAPVSAGLAQSPSVANRTDLRENIEEKIGFLREALSDIHQLREQISTDDKNELIQKVEFALKQAERDIGRDTAHERKLKAASDHDADVTQGFILVLTPIFCGIVFVMAFTPVRPRKVNPVYLAGAHNLRMEAIDFNVSDDDFLELRRRVLAVARLTA